MFRFLSVFSVLVFIAHIIYLLFYWNSIPETIPIQLNQGSVQGWGSKWLLFLAPTIGLAIWFFIHLLMRNPEKLNYINLTEANKEWMYERGRQLSYVVKNCSFLIFIFMNQAFIFEVLHKSSEWAFVLAMLSGGFTVIYPMYVGYKMLMLKV